MSNVTHRRVQALSVLAALLRTRSTSTDATDLAELGDSTVAARTSTLKDAGLGAFALRTFSKDEFIGTYNCTVTLASEANKQSLYVWDVNNTHSCDAEHLPHRNPLRYVNSIAGVESCGLQNVKMEVRPSASPSPITYVALKRIDVGDELLSDYGATYFKYNQKLVAKGIVYECGMSALHVASGRGELKTVQRLIDRAGIARAATYVNKASKRDPFRVALHEAASSGHTEVAKLLIAARATVDFGDKHGMTPLIVAGQIGHVPMISLLTDSGGDIDRQMLEGVSTLWIATYKGHVESVRQLLAGGASVDLAKPDKATTPLFIASERGHVKIVRMLLNAGASINQPNFRGTTPVTIASQEGHLNVVRVLAKRRADLWRANSRGGTPLIMAENNNHQAVVDLLHAFLQTSKRKPKHEL